MNEIGWAVKQMRDGRRVARSGWNGKNMWLALCGDDTAETEDGALDAFVYMKTAGGTLVPWLCSQTDLLATDWEVLSEE